MCRKGWCGVYFWTVKPINFSIDKDDFEGTNE